MATKYAPHTASSAYARAKAKVDSHASNVVGMCAHEVIVNILGIPGPWKWGGNGRAYAINYFLGAQKVVRTNDPAKIPAGAIVIWGPRVGATTVGGKAGHIAVGAGNGMCFSTDLPRTGYWGKVPIRDVTRLWGKPLVGYVLVDGMGYDLRDKPSTSTPSAPTRSSSVLIQNCASSMTDIGAGHWSKRWPILAKVILASEASFIVCPELYAAQRPDLSKAIAVKYAEAGYHEGRVIYRRKGRWQKTTTAFWKNLLDNKRKPAIAATFKHQDKGWLLTIIGMHTTPQTTALGSSSRRKEIAVVVEWARRRFTKNVGRRIFVGDVNAPAGGTTRTDDVGPVFAAAGYHDLGIEAGAETGPGRYHLDRGFAGNGVHGQRVVVIDHEGSDHPATYIEFTF